MSNDLTNTDGPTQNQSIVVPTAFSRRSMLSRSAKLVGGGALAMTLAGLPGNFTALAASGTATDLDVLNYALTLEHLEYAFYRDGLEKFNNNDFLKTQALRDLGRQVVQKVYKNLKLIRDHEQTHVDTLTSVITKLGGKPATECKYKFPYKDVAGFLAVAQALENTGVMAYDGAVALVTDKGVLTASATIATVEARHASYLNLLNNKTSFPDAFDTPKSMDEILKIAGQFIVSC